MLLYSNLIILCYVLLNFEYKRLAMQTSFSALFQELPNHSSRVNSVEINEGKIGMVQK